MSLQDAFQAYQSGDLKSAEAKLGPLVLRDETKAQALHLGAMVAARAGNPQLAFQRIQASLSDPTNRHEKLNILGNILVTLGADVDSERAFRAALAASPNYLPAAQNLAAYLVQSGQPEEGHRIYAQLADKLPDVALHHRGHIQSLLDMNRDAEALEAIETAGLPGAEAATLRARALFAMGRFEEAIGANARAYDDPQYGSEALRLTLQILSMTGAWEGMAEAVLEDVLGRHPDSDALHSVALHALQRRGDTEAAADLFARAPQGPATLSKRAEQMIADGDYAEAERLAQATLSKANGFPPALMQFCFASLGLGKFDQAQNISDIALRANRNDQFFYAIKAVAGRLKGQDYRYYFDYDRFVRPYDVLAPEGWGSVEAFNADLKAELEALHGFTSEPLDQTLRTGTQTSPNLRFVDSPAIKAFFGAVRPAIQSYVDSLGHDPQHAFLRRNTGHFRIRSGWSVRLSGGGHHVSHVHPDGWISSAYYVDVPRGKGDEGKIQFGAPPEPLAGHLGLTPELTVQPKPGRLVLFPSYLWHGTVPITEGKTRMTLPIDIMPAAN